MSSTAHGELAPATVAAVPVLVHGSAQPDSKHCMTTTVLRVRAHLQLLDPELRDIKKLLHSILTTQLELVLISLSGCLRMQKLSAFTGQLDQNAGTGSSIQQQINIRLSLLIIAVGQMGNN